MIPPWADTTQGDAMIKTVFISRRLECGAALAIAMSVMLMVSVAVSVWPASPPEEPQEVLKAYNRLVWLSSELDNMASELRELDELLARNWTVARLEDRLRLQREVNSLGRKYAETAGNYNRSMSEIKYRFADPAKLPTEATFGPLPRRREPFILLKSGPRA